MPNRLFHEWEIPSLTARKREPAHAPLACGPDNPFVLVLDGTWRFHWAPNPAACPPGFEEGGFDDADWEEISVPGNWQLRPESPDKPVYANEAYPFDPTPPRVPDANPTGCYRRDFTVPDDWMDRDLRLVFEAVDAAFHVWLNGVEIGYATDSRLPSEFRISPIVKPGRNVIAVRVLRYCAGSYLEDQDFWHMSGIQRGVWIAARPPIHLQDYRVQTRFDAAYTNAVLDATLYLETANLPDQVYSSRWLNDYPDVFAFIVLLDLEGREVMRAGPKPFPAQAPMYGERLEKGAARFELEITEPAKWSPDHPNLYTLLMRIEDGQGVVLDAQSTRLGFRQVEIRNRQILLNGRRLLIRGVNRHEFHPDRGRAVTLEDMRWDVLWMKRLNFNAVRTAHYPNDSRWYDLCDEYGLCVMGEANLETHGLGATVSRDPEWLSAFMERMTRMVLRDRNHASILFWSPGNESCADASHAAMVAWTRFTDPTRPVVYASWNPGPDTTDVMAPMYCELNWVHDVMADPTETRPMIFSEYAYAKGNATGNFSKYWALVDRYLSFQGGFVWEWMDKSIRFRLPDGRKVLGYGNDLGENFDYEAVGEDPTQVLNGIMGGDLDPHPGVYEIQYVQAPVKMRRVTMDPPTIELANHYHDRNLNVLRLEWEITAEGLALETGSMPLPDIPAGETGRVRLMDALPEVTGEAFLNLYAVLAEDLPWAGAGQRVAWEQVPLPFTPAETEPSDGQPLRMQTTDHELRICGAAGELVWSRRDGRLVSWIRDGHEWLAAPVEEIIHRAPTDNDWILGKPGNYLTQWAEAGLLPPRRELVSMDSREGKRGEGIVRVESRLCGVDEKHCLDAALTWTLHPDGRLDLHQRLAVPETVPLIARLGVRFQISPGAAEVEWFGRGHWENYPDRQEGAMVGLWRSSVAGMLERYPVPGECGGRGDVRCLTLETERGGSLEVRGERPFRFSALPVTPEDLRAARHFWELTPTAETCLILEGAHMGLGGDTGWTPNVHPEYRIGPGLHEWSVTLRLHSPYITNHSK